MYFLFNLHSNTCSVYLPACLSACLKSEHVAVNCRVLFTTLCDNVSSPKIVCASVSY